MLSLYQTTAVFSYRQSKFTDPYVRQALRVASCRWYATPPKGTQASFRNGYEREPGMVTMFWIPVIDTRLKTTLGALVQTVKDL